MLALLPLMNDLRAVREAPLVSETSLFAPKAQRRHRGRNRPAGFGQP